MAEVRPREADLVDPDIRAFQRAVSRDYALFSKDAADTAEARRQVAEKVRERWRSGGPAMAETRTLVFPSGVRIRIQTPRTAKPGKVLIYLHGGGWVMFSIDTHDRLMREYADRCGVIVVGVDYSLAPENRYPRALDEVSSVVDWVASGSLGEEYEAPDIFLGGDSAGANLAIAAAMLARDEARRAVDGLILNYGAYDFEERPSHRLYDGDNYMLTRNEMAQFWGAYLGEGRSAPGVYACPLKGDLQDLPPTFMCIAECDILFDENIELAAKLREAGVKVTDKIYQGATHSFLEAISISSLAARAFDDAADWFSKIS